jgi:restriction endonuclease S subunit
MNFNGNSGARLDRFSISDAVFWQMPIQYPQIEEQQKTAKLITTLSNLLSLREKQLTLLKHTKQALLEQMFVNE